jgi:hydroxymethylpyrimidine/phosphomethylpyrimidine kinase
VTTRVLIIAGSDSGGGAGIQGDLKTVTALGGYGMTAITALTAQNTQGVFGIHDVPPAFIAQQIELCLSDIGADAIKTGMLSTIATIDAVAFALSRCDIPLIVDPVMVAKGGAALLQAEAVDALKTKLLPLAYLVTPNIPEAEILAGMPITTRDAMAEAAKRIHALGCANVLIKGGHLETGDTVTNVLFDGTTVERFEAPRLQAKNTHGTGCTMASALATFIGGGMDLKTAVEKAHAYVAGAIQYAPNLGHGHGPLWHMWEYAPT